MTRAGFPTAIEPAGSDRVTTELAPMMHPSPISTPATTMTRAPSQTSSPTTTSRSILGWSLTGVPGSVW